MAIAWTKNWGPSDDGTILKGVDLKNIQDDIDATGVSDATKIHGFDIDVPTISDDGKALTFDNTGAKFTYTSLSGLPAGTGPIPYAGSTVPAGWLFCTGAAVSRTTYADLFTAIGTTYGVGDGSTTFNLPDLRGRFPLGLDNMGGTPANRVTDAAADTLGGTSGAESKNISHNHGGATGSYTLLTADTPSHTHTSKVETGGAAGVTHVNANSDGTGTPILTGATGGGGGHSHTVSTDGSTTQNVVNPFIAFNYMIKT